MLTFVQACLEENMPAEKKKISFPPFFLRHLCCDLLKLVYLPMVSPSFPATSQVTTQVSEKREGVRFFSSSIGVSVQARPVLKSTSISLFHIVLVPICMRKRDSEQPGTVHPSLGPPFFDISWNLSKFPRDYEKSKHRCLYLLYMTKHCLHNWFLQIWC